MADNLSEFLGQFEASPSFCSKPWYNRYGDCIEFCFAPDEYYAERIDDVLTVFLSQSTRDVVGCQVKGVSALMKKTGKWNLRFEARKIPIGALFLLSYFDADDVRVERPRRRQFYKDIRDRLASAEIDAEELVTQ